MLEKGGVKASKRGSRDQNADPVNLFLAESRLNGFAGKETGVFKVLAYWVLECRSVGVMGFGIL